MKIMKTQLFTSKLVLMFLFLMLGLASAGWSKSIYFTSEGSFGIKDIVKVQIDTSDLDYVQLRVYQVDNPQEYLLNLSSVHNPEVENNRYAVSFPDLVDALQKQMKDYAVTFARGNLRPRFRDNLMNALGMQYGLPVEEGKEEYQLFPYLEDMELITEKKVEFRSRYNYYKTLKLPDVNKPGVYLIEAIAEDVSAYTLVIVSDIVFVTKNYNDGMLVYVVDRYTGQPVEQADVLCYRMEDYNQVDGDKGLLDKGISSYDGTFFRHSKEQDENRTFIMVKKQKHFAVDDPYYYHYYNNNTDGTYSCYLYTSRPVYRPGQEVSFKAIVRELVDNQYEKPAASASIDIAIETPSGETVYNKSLHANRFGTVEDKFTLKALAHLGRYYVDCEIDGQRFSNWFSVEEYRKPEFEVQVETEKEYYILGEEINATVKADYYYGSPVSSGDVTYNIYREVYYIPWWYDSEMSEYSWYYSSQESDYNYYGRRAFVASGTGKLEPDGTLRIHVKTKKPEESSRSEDDYYSRGYYDYRYIIEAEVTDISRLTFNGTSSHLVTRSDFYLRINTDKWVYKPKEDVEIQIKARTYDNQVVSEYPIEISIQKEVYKENKWIYTTIDSEKVKTRDDGQFTYTYAFPSAGYYRIKVFSKDKLGNETEETHWVYIYSQDWASGSSSSDLTIITDKQVYHPDETANIVITTPMKKGHLLFTLEHSQLAYQTVLPVSNYTAKVQLPLQDNYSPNCFIKALAFFDDTYYLQSKELIIPPENKFLTVEVKSDQESYRPGQKAEFEVTTLDWKNNPVSAEVSVGIVDDSIYAIKPESVGDIRQYFYGRRSNQISTSASFDYRFWDSGKINLLMSSAQTESSIRFAAGKSEDELVDPDVREIFKDQVIWLPNVVTDTQGKAMINFHFPDNLTRWRTTARAVTNDTQVGSVVNKTIVRKDLIVRLILPRFLTQKDHVTISTVVHNYLDENKKVRMTLESDGLEVDSMMPRDIEVKAQGEARVDWPVSALNAGKITFIAKALTNEESDAVKKELKVIPYGVKNVDYIARELPKDNDVFDYTFQINSDFALGSTQLKLDLTPSLIAAMNQAIPHLIGMPYGCVEQTMSKFLPIVLVKEIVDETGYENPELFEKMETYGTEGIKRLYDMQHNDGCWGWWSNDSTNPYYTAYALGGLMLAQLAGFDIRTDVLEQGIRGLEELLKVEQNDATKLFMLKTLTMTEKKYTNEIKGIYERKDKLNSYSKALLALVMQNNGMTNDVPKVIDSLKHEKIEENNMVHWTGQKFKYDWRNDVEETTAHVAMALTSFDQNDEDIAKVIRWMLYKRQGGHWNSTKASAIMIHALYQIAKKRNELIPQYSTKVYLNDKLIKTFDNLKNIRNLSDLTMEIPEKALSYGDNQVRIVKDGRGTLYFTSALHYYKVEDPIDSVNQGFQVNRQYFRLEPFTENGEIHYQKIPLYSGTVTSGDKILVEVDVKMKPGLENVLIEDFLPAGCEVIQEDKGYYIKGNDHYRGYTNWSYWYSAREVHDEHIGIALTHNYDDDYSTSYLLRAQIPGQFFILPARAYLMYYPEVYGYTEDEMLNIVDKE